jgi:hypothetical protein
MTPTTPRPRLRARAARGRAVATALLLCLALAACQTTTASPSPSPSASPAATPSVTATASGSAGPTGPAASGNLDATYREIEAETSAIRGLQAKSPVDPIVLDEAGIRRITSEGFEKDNPADIVAANERLLKGLGLLPKDASLADLYVEMLGSQVAGLYSPDDKQLYVVSRSGRIGPTEKVTFSHEYTHALQDQNFDLSSLKLDELGEGDRGLARLALVEGDATLTMTLWQLANLSRLELLQLIGESLNPEISASLERMPPVLQESLLFPYTSGLAFVQTLQAQGWQAVNDAFGHPPASTEQILHPEKYLADEAPVDVSLPADLATRMGQGWKAGLEDTLGEFQIRVWLQHAAAGGDTSAAGAAEGWGGDRVTLLDGPDGAWAIALSTAWDTPEDAREFSAAASGVVSSLGAGKVAPGGDDRSVIVLLGSSVDVLEQLRAAVGA